MGLTWRTAGEVAVLLAAIVTALGVLWRAFRGARANFAVQVKEWFDEGTTRAVAPLLKQMAADERERQEIVAKHVAEVAEQAAEVASRLLAANERVASATQHTNVKLDVIHTLVNSNMTAAKEAELDAKVSELAMMREVVALREAAGQKPNAETLAAMEAKETRIEALRADLADRASQAGKAEDIAEQEPA